MLECNGDLFALSPLEFKMSDKKRPRKLKIGTSFTIFNRVQQAFSAHSVINNYLFECFKIEWTKLLITIVNPQFV